MGQAWETSANPGVKQVRVAVGLMRHDPTVKGLLEQISLLQQKLAALDARLAASERNTQMTAARKPGNRQKVARLRQ